MSDHADTCDCTACQLRRMVDDLKADNERLRGNIARLTLDAGKMLRTCSWCGEKFLARVGNEPECPLCYGKAASCAGVGCFTHSPGQLEQELAEDEQNLGDGA